MYIASPVQYSTCYNLALYSSVFPSSPWQTCIIWRVIDKRAKKTPQLLQPQIWRSESVTFDRRVSETVAKIPGKFPPSKQPTVERFIDRAQQNMNPRYSPVLEESTTWTALMWCKCRKKNTGTFLSYIGAMILPKPGVKSKQISRDLMRWYDPVKENIVLGNIRHSGRSEPLSPISDAFHGCAHTQQRALLCWKIALAGLLI